MSPLLFILLSPVYFFVLGVFARRFYLNRTSECERCSKNFACGNDHISAALFAGLVWPATLPVCLGFMWASREPKLKHTSSDRVLLLDKMVLGPNGDRDYEPYFKDEKWENIRRQWDELEAKANKEMSNK